MLSTLSADVSMAAKMVFEQDETRRAYVRNNGQFKDRMLGMMAETEISTELGILTGARAVRVDVGGMLEEIMKVSEKIVRGLYFLHRTTNISKGYLVYGEMPTDEKIDLLFKKLQLERVCKYHDVLEYYYGISESSALSVWLLVYYARIPVLMFVLNEDIPRPKKRYIALPTQPLDLRA